MDEVLANPDILINALLELKAERERAANLEAIVAVQSQQMIEMQPKVSYYDVVLNCKDLVAISVIAKDYGWSATKMNQYLQQKGVQYKQGGKIWLLYQKYAEKGYTRGGITEEFYHGTGLDEDTLLKRYLDDNLYEVVKI